MKEDDDTPNVKHIKRISTLIDCIMPDDMAGITPASEAITPIMLESIRDSDIKKWIIDLSQTLEPLSPGARIAALEAAERAAPARFEQLVAAVYAAYYGAPAGIARVARLAEALPSSPSPWFDATALSSVIRDQRGRRTP